MSRKQANQKAVEFSFADYIPLLKKHDLDPTAPKILENVVKHYKDIVGEESNIKLIFLAATSRKLPKHLRIHINNYSTTGAGKSWVIRKVLRPFWKDVEEITRYTEAWLSRTVDELDGKILLWQEVNKTDEQGKGVTGQIKILLTDEGISYRHMENTSEGWVSKNSHSKALPVVITTTTKQLNGEDSRRFFTLNSDEGDEQTLRIMKHSLTKASSVNFQKEIEEKYEQLEILVNLYEKLAEGITDVIIPYAPYLADMLPKYFQMRTDITKLIQLIKLVAFIHIMNRKLVILKKDSQDEEEKYLIADVEDLYEAIDIASKILNQTNSGLSYGSLKVYEFLEEFSANKGEDMIGVWPTLQECELGLDMPHSTFHSYLKPLEENGLIEKGKIEGSNEKCLMLTLKNLEKFSLKEFEFTDDNLDEWFKKEFDDCANLVSFKEFVHMDV